MNSKHSKPCDTMFSLNEMLQRRKWKKGVVQRHGCDVKITVSPSESGVDLVAALTMERSLEMKVADIFADTGWTGLGHVRITTKWQRYTVFYDLLNEDAIRFARELKRAAQ